MIWPKIKTAIGMYILQFETANTKAWIITGVKRGKRVYTSSTDLPANSRLRKWYMLPRNRPRIICQPDTVFAKSVFLGMYLR